MAFTKREFWQRIFIASISNGTSRKIAKTVADDAVMDYRDEWGTQGEGGDPFLDDADDREAEWDTPKEQTSKNLHRLKQNPLEATFLRTWEQRAKTLEYILSRSENEPDPVSDRDHEVAATVIQWLGTPVGQVFLETALGIEVRRLLPDDRRVKYD